MSEPVDEAVRELAWQIRHKSALDAERLLREQLAPLLRAGQAMCHSHNRAEWDAAFAKLTGRTP